MAGGQFNIDFPVRFSSSEQPRSARPKRIGAADTLGGHLMDALTRHQIALLKELQSAGEHGRMIRLKLISRGEVAHLIAVQYIKRLRHG